MSEVLGADGGTLVADGVEVTIPAGAVSSFTRFSLTVGADALVTITPDIYFAEGSVARVKMSGERWTLSGPRIGQHGEAGEFYMLDPVVENDDGSWEYETPGFSDVRALPANVRTLAASAPALAAAESTAPWTVADCWPDVVESASTKRQRDLRPADVTTCCLVDGSEQIGNRHDKVTGKHAPKPDGDGTRSADEYDWMTQEALTALTDARKRLAETLPDYDIWVNGAWDSSGQGTHTTNSNHHFGMALDLALCKVSSSTPGACTKVATQSLLGQLPELLIASGFTWIWYEDAQHIHASITSPSLDACVRTVDIEGEYASRPAPVGVNPACTQPDDGCFCNYDGVECNDSIFRKVILDVFEDGRSLAVGFTQCYAGFSVTNACHRGDTIVGKVGSTDGDFIATFTSSAVSGHYEIEGWCGDANGADFAVTKRVLTRLIP